MKYIELSLLLTPDTPTNREVLVAALSDMKYDSFWEEDDQLRAYIKPEEFKQEDIEVLKSKFHKDFSLESQYQSLDDKNWNEEWEKNFNPVLINKDCAVRAPFHKPYEDIKYELIIHPEMAFGTSHHETTAMILDMMTHMKFRGRKVLDMGSGTGILAILADKMKATEVIAVDNEEWAVRNSEKNAEYNEARIKIIQGDIDTVENKHFDIILANINRNILLRHLPTYGKILPPGGEIILSGFYSEDLESLRKKAGENHLILVDYMEKRNWIAALFKKQ